MVAVYGKTILARISTEAAFINLSAHHMLYTAADYFGDELFDDEDED